MDIVVHPERATELVRSSSGEDHQVSGATTDGIGGTQDVELEECARHRTFFFPADVRPLNMFPVKQCSHWLIHV